MHRGPLPIRRVLDLIVAGVAVFRLVSGVKLEACRTNPDSDQVRHETHGRDNSEHEHDDAASEIQSHEEGHVLVHVRFPMP